MVQIQQPSLSSILEVLNVLNGIIIIQVGGASTNEEPTSTAEAKEETKETNTDGGDMKNLVEEALD